MVIGHKSKRSRVDPFVNCEIVRGNEMTLRPGRLCRLERYLLLEFDLSLYVFSRATQHRTELTFHKEVGCDQLTCSNRQRRSIPDLHMMVGGAAKCLIFESIRTPLSFLGRDLRVGRSSVASLLSHI